MVKKTELRIGYVFKKKGQFVSLTAQDIINLLSLPGKYVPIAPIPLTPDRLRKIGFKQRGEWLDLFRFTNKGYVSLRYRVQVIDGVEQFVEGSGLEGIAELPDYIHQIQELCYAMLGKDLPFDRSQLK